MLTIRDFEKISIRATVAYAICCLENALEYYNLNGEGWNFLLRQMWRYTQLSLEVENGICSYDTWEDVVRLLPWRSDIYNRLDNEGCNTLNQKLKWRKITPSEYSILQQSYSMSNDVINTICINIYHGGMGQTYCGFGKKAEYLLDYIKVILDTMIANKIPLPDIEPFKQYPFNRHDYDEDTYGWGYPFDGTQYSKYVNSDEAKNIKSTT